MRTTWLLTALSVIQLASICPSATAARYAVLPRQASFSAPVSAAASSSATSSPSSASTTQSTKQTLSTHSSSSASADSATSSNLPTSSSLVPSATPTPLVNGPLNGNVTTTPKITGLPIQPEITPALSVAGAILILTGIFYTLIGIKTKWLQIFLSAAYLFALGVTLLIVYVMHPPVTNAVQGAFLVAACITGLIAGGASVWFADMTEGLGCILGGFCLSMWFLVLKPNGLIPETDGKAIFISCFTAGGFALYISRHTRAYGLIASTSFAGATAIVLGIDCFSRAGLKEFWLYIWNLNDAMFPLHYYGPYPITRGMRVETACVVIISVLGIMSQLKVWKIIKKKREARAADQLRKDRERDIADEEQGRKIEQGTEQERTTWEAVYGGKDRKELHNTDSGIGSDEPSITRKGSMNTEVREFDAEGMELQNLNGSTTGSKEGGRVTIHVAQDDEIREMPSASGKRSTDSAPKPSRESSIKEPRAGSSNRLSSETSSSKATASKDSPKLVDPTLTLKPKVVRIPFQVPDVDSQSDGEGSSVAGAASEHLSTRHSKAISSLSILRELSKRSQKNSMNSTKSEEALMIPHVEDDRASSVAATVDGVSELGDTEEIKSTRNQNDHLEVTSIETAIQTPEDLGKANGDEPVAPENLELNAPSIGDPPSPVMPVGSESHPPSIMDAQSANEQANGSPSAKSIEASETSGRRPTRASLSGNLPEGASKVVTAYRTNEWAKHLDRADLPDIDELKAGHSQAAMSGAEIERPAPVNVRALQQTPLTAEPAPILTDITHTLDNKSPNSPKSPSYFKSKNPYIRQEEGQKSRFGLGQSPPKKTPERNESQTSLTENMARTPSQTSLSSVNSRQENYRPALPKQRSSQTSAAPSRTHRSSSTPLAATPLAELPIEEGVESSFPARFTPSTTHLISQRDSMVRNKPSSTSLLRASWSNANLDQHPALRQLEEDHDDITLSQRKSLLQQNPRVAPQPRRTVSGTSTPMQPLSHQTLTRSALTPQLPRPKPNKRDSAESAWRASLQPSTTAHLHAQEMETRRTELLAQKRRDSSNQQQQQFVQGRRESVIDMGMRRGSMLDLHREAMRKMQSEVNKTFTG